MPTGCSSRRHARRGRAPMVCRQAAQQRHQVAQRSILCGAAERCRQLVQHQVQDLQHSHHMLACARVQTGLMVCVASRRSATLRANCHRHQGCAAHAALQAHAPVLQVRQPLSRSSSTLRSFSITAELCDSGSLALQHSSALGSSVVSSSSARVRPAFAEAAMGLSGGGALCQARLPGGLAAVGAISNSTAR